MHSALISSHLMPCQLVSMQCLPACRIIKVQREPAKFREVGSTPPGKRKLQLALTNGESDTERTLKKRKVPGLPAVVVDATLAGGECRGSPHTPAVEAGACPVGPFGASCSPLPSQASGSMTRSKSSSCRAAELTAGAVLPPEVSLLPPSIFCRCLISCLHSISAVYLLHGLHWLGSWRIIWTASTALSLVQMIIQGAGVMQSSASASASSSSLPAHIVVALGVADVGILPAVKVPPTLNTITNIPTPQACRHAHAHVK